MEKKGPVFFRTSPTSFSLLQPPIPMNEVTRSVGFSGRMTDPILGVGISGIWGDDIMIVRSPGVGFSGGMTDPIRDVGIPAYGEMVSHGIGFSGVETDPIRGVGISGVWGNDMIVSYRLFDHLLFSPFHVHNINLLTLHKEQVHAENLYVTIFNYIEGNSPICAVQVAQLVRIYGGFKLGFLGRLLVSTKSRQVVPKKSRITVVQNDNNELVPTMLTTDPITPEDQEKTNFTCPFGTFAYRRKPFGLCNAPATFQRCMMSIFSDMVERIIEVFMDDFSVFGNSFDQCLEHLSLVSERCKETNLILNWEKCHFMVKHGIVLGHLISSKGIEVDKAKIDLIAKLPLPTLVKDIKSFLGHTGFYRRFIKDLSKISNPLCHLLAKDVSFVFNEACLEAFNTLNKLLTSALIIQASDWDLPFELMCDASDYALGAILGQRKDKLPYVIYYASRTLNDAQLNYSTTEKELLAVIFALEKFRSYLVSSKVIIYIDHAALKYLL
ncbi:hypothetical protein L3X38_024654 [Prunus dulcis]|uniref:Transposable element protein n=1 Tax=Prunus dulcis TaxID=3755 RepID=A0AAD4Z6L8_PRUDU|nr:hypothetical protein L3X38_024654 [Prunus dulcis]